MIRSLCKRSGLFGLLLCLAFTGVFLIVWPGSVSCEDKPVPGPESERQDGGYFTVVDEQKKVLLRTAHLLGIGDEYIAPDNMRYRISSMKGDFAEARLVGREAEAKLAEQPQPGLLQTLLGQGNRKGTIAIYHTHSDESYVPTDGTDSIYANGGIIKVGNVFKEKLGKIGIDAIHSKRPHDPHDANAYSRSRRTAAQLLQKQPLALFDIHRDAVPPDVYHTNVKGTPATRVKIVLGRSNPRMNSNLEFAKQVKAALDKTNPGMFQGILLTSGDFNQDLAPRSLLLEVGAHTNSRNDAQQGIAFFAESLPKVLGTTGVTPQVPMPTSNRGDWRALFWIILIAGVVLFGYLYVNTGSWQGAYNQMRNFFNSEFFGLVKRKGRK